MPVEILIPAKLRQYTRNADEIKVSAKDVREALMKISSDYSDLKKHLLTKNGELSEMINISVNGENIKDLDGLNTKLNGGDTLALIPKKIFNSSIISQKGLPQLSNQEMSRYSRHIILPEVGILGQRRLKAAKVLLIGSGGLGSPIALYLGAAGIGTIGIVDFDEVDESNLQRQIIHITEDIGRAKVDSAKKSIKDINPSVNVITFNTKLTSKNALEIFKDFDIVADCTDNFPTRYLVNDACVLLGKPYVYGSIFRFEGQASVFYAKKGPCYRCLFPTPPPPGLVPTCGEGGVLGVLPGIIGTIQANEIIKLIIGGGESLIGRLLLFDALTMKFREPRLSKDENCPICGKNPTITELIDYDDFCGLEQEKVMIYENISPRELKDRIDRGERINIVDVREQYEQEIAKFPNSIIIPLAQISKRVDEINPNYNTVVICKSGSRSKYAIKILKESGFNGKLYNLRGGINSWSIDVDDTIPRY